MGPFTRPIPTYAGHYLFGEFSDKYKSLSNTEFIVKTYWKSDIASLE